MDYSYSTCRLIKIQPPLFHLSHQKQVFVFPSYMGRDHLRMIHIASEALYPSLEYALKENS